MKEGFEEKVQELYQLAKEKPEDQAFQDAIEVIKSLRISRGTLQSWTGKYRDQIEVLETDIDTLEGELVLKGDEKIQLERQLDAANQEITTLIQNLEQITIKKDRLYAELRQMEQEAYAVAERVRKTNSIFGKFQAVWQFLQLIFFEDDPKDPGTIDLNPEADPEKPQMGSGVTNTQRSLLDK